MQMTGDPSPLLRAPPRGFRDKSRRNYNAFNRHVRHFCNKCLITRPWPAFATFLRMGVREQRRRESDAVAPGLLQCPALRSPLSEEAAHVRDQDLSRASGVGGHRGH